jgi:hypothetical protein
MSKVFISYSRADASTADELTSVLSDLGIDYFRDIKDIIWGNSITSEVRDALDACVALLVILSPASQASQWVPYEIGHAKALRKIILPYLTHPSLVVPDFIRDHNYTTDVVSVREYFTNRFVHDANEVALGHKQMDLLKADEVDQAIGTVRERLNHVKQELRVSGNDCKFVVESLSAEIERLLLRNVAVKVLCSNPVYVKDMIALVDPRIGTAAEFHESISSVRLIMDRLKAQFPDLFEYRLLPVLPAMAFFITDPGIHDGLVKVELYPTKPYETRPHFVIPPDLSEWRNYFLQQWNNYWRIAEVPANARGAGRRK